MMVLNVKQGMQDEITVDNVQIRKHQALLGDR